MSAKARLLGFVALMSLGVSVPLVSDACAPAPPPNVVVDIASESAIIVWDEKTKTQHFIRRAVFQTKSPGEQPVQDFGFLVPTPTEPQLAEADDKAFDTLAKITEPRTEKRPRPSGGGCAIGCAMSKAPDMAGASVEVLAEKHVAGYDAKVLKADSADALTTWLNDRGYEIRPALTRWLKPYVDRGWIITAFKIARDPQATPDTAIGSQAVRMSFQTETPFFPYREPDDMHESKVMRLLRIYFIGSHKMNGWIGDQKVWPGKVAWADRLGEEDWKKVQSLIAIPSYQPMEMPWLTEFEDRSSPRPGQEDLIFDRHADSNPVARPPRIIYTATTDTGAMPTYLGFAALAMCLVLVRRARFSKSPVD